MRSSAGGDELRFRLHLNCASGLRTYVGEERIFAHPGSHSVSVTLHPPDSESEGVYCVSEGIWRVDADLLAVMDDLAAHRLPEALSGRKFTGRGSAIRLEGVDVPIDAFPHGYKAFALEVSRELRRAADRTLRSYAWRFDLLLGERLIKSSRETEWSRDGRTWESLAGPLVAEVRVRPKRPKLGKVESERLAELIEQEATEPIGQQLRREARSRQDEDPRSSLILALAALEIGVKGFIAERVPGSQWLVEKLPAPGVVRMLAEYVPILVAPDQHMRVPDRVLRELRVAVGHRNDLVHIGAAAPLTGRRLDEILTAVADVLYILDWHRGFDWAVNRLSDETLEDLKLIVDNTLIPPTRKADTT